MEKTGGSAGSAGDPEDDEEVQVSPDQVEDLYNRVLHGCARYLGLTDPRVIGQMTVREYNEMMRAVAYKHIDEEFQLKVLAWDINQAGAMKSRAGGKTEPAFKTFQDFYDYDKAVSMIGKPQEPVDSLAARMARYYKDKDKDRKE